ncbi:MAG: FAD-binding oxidoreductase, partial [Gammaproteobacteria bacterium]|nr:FAD-binding oxidoreductase [Gammaproteobacteria bacterium]
MNRLTENLSGWGRYPVAQCGLLRPERHKGLGGLSAEGGIARGQGRSYGDAALNQDGAVLLTERLNRLSAFDSERGTVTAESGLTLRELLDVVVPRGWFPLVTPGTGYVSLGGCIAADVHGKNHHHDGAFSRSVLEFELFDADGAVRTCSPDVQSEAFNATMGGMGLTGVIGDVTLQLRPVETAWIQAQHAPARDLEQALTFLQDNEHDARYSVAWIDLQSRGRALGRSVVMTGEHAVRDALPAAHRADPLQLKLRGERNVPLDMPGWLLNPLTIRAFNALYYRLEGRKTSPFIVGYDKFFYPLDALGHWNRLYGKRGFVQYQCVVPLEQAHETLRQLLDALAASGHAAFLGVLKRLGAASAGQLAFSMPGYTLALDLPFGGAATLELLQRFDEIVLAHGGRVYLAKDARLSAESFRQMYPRYDEWLAVKQTLDPQGRFSSSLSRRLGIG